MALFKARILVVKEVEIPVDAADEEAALAFLKRTDEWRDDEGFECDDRRSPMVVLGVEQITDPKLSPFEGGVYPWGPDQDNEFPAAVAFYGKPSEPEKPRTVEECEQMSESEWRSYFAEQNAKIEELVERFDAVRKGGGS